MKIETKKTLSTSIKFYEGDYIIPDTDIQDISIKKSNFGDLIVNFRKEAFLLIQDKSKIENLKLLGKQGGVCKICLFGEALIEKIYLNEDLHLYIFQEYDRDLLKAWRCEEIEFGEGEIIVKRYNFGLDGEISVRTNILKEKNIRKIKIEQVENVGIYGRLNFLQLETSFNQDRINLRLVYLLDDRKKIENYLNDVVYFLKQLNRLGEVNLTIDLDVGHTRGITEEKLEFLSEWMWNIESMNYVKFRNAWVILSWIRNIEVRRKFLNDEKYKEQFVRLTAKGCGYEKIDSTEKGALLRFDDKNCNFQVLWLKDYSTDREYYLLVPRRWQINGRREIEIDSVEKARAWTFDIPVEEWLKAEKIET